MTAIAGVIHRGRVWLAGDDAVTSEDGDRVLTSSPKVWVQEGYAIGVCGAPQLDRVLFRLNWDASATWWRNRAPEALAERVRQADLDPDDVGALIGAHGQLWYLDGHSLYRSADNFGAVGCAGPHVMGYLDATRGVEPASRLRAAIRSAARYCNDVAVHNRVTIVHT